ncbi:MAG TPA: hypothetical protein VGS07_29135 [Thermoanaerobaculia bacterium]|jgi:hypothetical protein|nr:hypothetical protein [Thermoanaerobaculia bacterium]
MPAMERVLRQNRLDAEDRQAFEAPGDSGLGLEGLYHDRDACPIDLGLKVRPAGDWRENDKLLGGKLERGDVLPPIAGGEFLGA